MIASYQLPEATVWAMGVGTPASAFIGALIGHVLTRRGAKELDRRSRREEVMRNLRWAAELAVSSDHAKADLGVAELVALSESDLLDEEAQGFIDAALDTVVEEPVEELEQRGPDSEAVPAEEGDLDSNSGAIEGGSDDDGGA